MKAELLEEYTSETPPFSATKGFLHFLAYTYLQHNRIQEACVIFRVLRHANPRDCQVALSLSYCLQALEQPIEALNEAEKAWFLALDQELAGYALLLKSKAMWKLNRHQEARHLFREFLRLKNSK